LANRENVIFLRKDLFHDVKFLVVGMTATLLFSLQFICMLLCECQDRIQRAQGRIQHQARVYTTMKCSVP